MFFQSSSSKEQEGEVKRLMSSVARRDELEPDSRISSSILNVRVLVSPSMIYYKELACWNINKKVTVGRQIVTYRVFFK